ncbi:hypothetical protein IFM89_017731 [Coptis chinensis]|uniref:3-beta hydroxysteroid dehydrogenase/isomerase domain-containing protein n=1 Tax=Coptis chinensis TaxID=261450 RepID=A0A835LJQ9_9MAGN|nr:hypothetical protein IFM89_017731 [Coptis chinensis]
MCFLQDRLRSVAHNTVFKIDNGMESSSTLNTIKGCQGVFHTASSVTNDPEQMVEPAVIGTKFVIDAAAETGVCRVVCTSSIGAVTMDPNRGPDVVVDEIGIVMTKQRSKAAKMGDGKRERSRFGGGEPFVGDGYLCAKRVLHRSDVVEILAKFFPEYPIPTKESMNCKSCKNMVSIPLCSNYYGYGIMHSYRFCIMEKDLAGKFLSSHPDEISSHPTADEIDLSP